MESCDTFVVMSNLTSSGDVIFGKNSDRPVGEVQEVVRIPSKNYQPNSNVQCTYIEIPQVEQTFEVVLSKPAWLWGAEMGANEFGVAIGNEAVWNRLSCPKFDSIQRLLGMDLLRLGLERGKSAREALDVITKLLEIHGQGGPCSDIVPEHTYHNSFLIADPNEAWVLETARNYWVAELVTDRFRNISNCMSIGTKIDLMSNGLKEKAQNDGWWDGETTFNWTEVIGEANQLPTTKLATPKERYNSGQNLLKVFTQKGQFSPKCMMKVLRDVPSCICRPYYPKKGCQLLGNPTTGSMVCQLSKESRNRKYWLTATPDPSISIFKPFQFTKEDDFSLTESPLSFPKKTQLPDERMHELWKTHSELNLNEKIDDQKMVKIRQELEDEFLNDEQQGKSFYSSAQKEIDVYQKCIKDV